MQLGAGGELTCDIIAVSWAVSVMTPTTMMSPAGAWPLTVMPPSADRPACVVTSSPWADAAGGRSARAAGPDGHHDHVVAQRAQLGVGLADAGGLVASAACLSRADRR